MEALYTVVCFAVVMGILWAVSHYAVHVYGPRRNRVRIMASLQKAASIGASDVSSNLPAATKRWIDLKRGVTQCKELKLEHAQQEIKKQLLILQPYEQQLNEQERKFRNRDATISNIGDVLNLIP